MAINSNVGNSSLNFVSSKVASNIDKILDGSHELTQTSNNINNVETVDFDNLNQINSNDEQKNVFKLFSFLELYLKQNNISNIIKLSDGRIQIETNEGTLFYFDLDSGLISVNGLTFEIDSKRNVLICSNNISIFDLNNISNGQYGGSQFAFRDNAEQLLEDPNILKILEENFPDATEEQYIHYFEKISNSGCSYTAMINSLFSVYEGKEQDFYDMFGFSMYTITSNGTIDYNYEPLILEWATYYWKNLYINDPFHLDSDVNNIDTIAIYSEGSSSETYQMFSQYLNEKYGISSEITLDDEKLSIEKYTSIVEDGKSVVYGGAGWDLYEINPDTGERGKLHLEDGYGHAMYVTGFTDNGDIIISSWGKQYILDTSNQSRGNYEIIDINL